MPDREKVIRLIEEEISVCESVNQCYRTIDLPALRDILALLKEQEAVEPKTDDAWPSRIKTCGACGTCLFAVGDYKPKYCAECGRVVKWT